MFIYPPLQLGKNIVLRTEKAGDMKAWGCWLHLPWHTRLGLQAACPAAGGHTTQRSAERRRCWLI